MQNKPCFFQTENKNPALEKARARMNVNDQFVRSQRGNTGFNPAVDDYYKNCVE